MSTVKFNGEDYPVVLDYSAIMRTLPLFGLKYISEIAQLQDKMAKEFPADAVCPFIHNVIRSGMRRSGDTREVPTLDDVEMAVNEDMSLIGQVVEAIADKRVELPAEAQKAVKGKKKAPTPKR